MNFTYSTLKNILNNKYMHYASTIYVKYNL
jgi:hypothetical protein